MGGAGGRSSASGPILRRCSIHLSELSIAVTAACRCDLLVAAPKPLRLARVHRPAQPSSGPSSTAPLEAAKFNPSHPRPKAIPFIGSQPVKFKTGTWRARASAGIRHMGIRLHEIQDGLYRGADRSVLTRHEHDDVISTDPPVRAVVHLTGGFVRRNCVELGER